MLTGAGLAPGFNWLFVQQLQLGLVGAAAANDCVQATSALLLAGFLVKREWDNRRATIRTWGGW